MSNDSGVFIGYASAHGSTQSIAERLAARLQEQGLSVSVSRLAVDTHLPADGPVVIGSAIHNRDWLPTAMAFVHAQHEQLARRPVWLFSVGMAAALPRPLRGLGGFERRAMARRVGMSDSVRGTAVFSGRVAPEHFPSRGSRLTFKLMGCRYGDFRDWNLVDAWADRIATNLTP